MLKAVLVKVRQSFVQVVTRELPPKIFVKEVISLPRTKSPDIFQVHLMHELFDVAVLANRRVCPIAVECIKPLVLVAQGPGCRYPRPFLIDRHCDQDVREQPARTNSGT